MKRLMVVSLPLLLAIPLAATAQNTVTAWNEIGMTAARASTAPGSATAGGTGIYIAYMQLAVYNAVNAIDGRFEPYKYTVDAPAGASADAAVIEASYRTLLYLLPDQAAYLEDQYNKSLATIANGDAKTNGQMVGLASANELISLRASDGRGANVPYTFPSAPTPGVWILTPGATAPQTPWVGKMRPFTFDDPAHFLPEPPPDLSSDTWARDFNEVKTLGRMNSTVRTPQQTQQALFWTDHGASQYGRMLTMMANDRHLSIPDTARLFAMSYTAYADAFIGCMNAKYTYSFWRPVTAIRNADIDGNADTTPDAAWLPLVTTPNHPEYPSAHGCVTGALAETLAAYFGTWRLPISVDSKITGTTRHFDNINDWQAEVGNARIYAGFHYRFSVRQGLILGHKVAHNLTAHYFRRVKGSDGNAGAPLSTAPDSESSPINRAVTGAAVVGSNATSSTLTTTSSVTGNWWGTFINDHVGNAHLWAPIIVTNGVISRTNFGFDTSECFYSGNITSGSVSGSTIKVNIHLLDNFSAGAYLNLSGTVSSSNTMSGAFTVGKTFCSFMPSSGTWKMNRVAKVSGTWVGWTKKSGSSTTQSFKLALNQRSNVGPLNTFNSYVNRSATPMDITVSSSAFQVTGNFQSSSSRCVSSAALALSSVLTGGIGGLQINFGTNASTGVRFYGELTGIGASKMRGTYRLASGPCKGQTGTFSLSRV